MIRNPKQRVAEAEHYPLAGRRSPGEGSIRLHFRSQVHHVSLAHRFRRTNFRSRILIEVLQIGERSLLFKSADTWPQMQHQLRHFEVRIGLYASEVAKGVIHIELQVAKTGRRLGSKSHAKEFSRGRGKSDGVLHAAVGWNIHQLAKGLAVVAGGYSSQRRRGA